jgi:hypothetical protein
MAHTLVMIEHANPKDGAMWLQQIFTANFAYLRWLGNTNELRSKQSVGQDHRALFSE